MKYFEHVDNAELVVAVGLSAEQIQDISTIISSIIYVNNCTYIAIDDYQDCEEEINKAIESN
jgi:hypothetical protein